jgi:hypothetical protein
LPTNGSEKEEDLVKTEDVLKPSVEGAPRNPVVEAGVERAKAWLAAERAVGTLLGEETLWREAFAVYEESLDDLSEDERRSAWACIAAELVFQTGKVPLNQRVAAREACDFLVGAPDLALADQARQLDKIAKTHNVDAGKVRALLGPGVGYPWVLPRARWTRELVVDGLVALLAPFEWEPGREPTRERLTEDASSGLASRFAAGLRAAAPVGTDLRRMVAAVESYTSALEREDKDVGAVEADAFVTALGYHGLSEGETSAWRADLLTLREAVVLVTSFELHCHAEGLVQRAKQVEEADPARAVRLLLKAAHLYKRLGVAQMYPERLLERHQQIVRAAEQVRLDHRLPDERADHVLLVSTYQSPGDLQRLVLSVGHELMDYAYGRQVHVVVSDDSTAPAVERNATILEQARRAGMHVSHWESERKNEFLGELNDEVFPDGAFDVYDLAGMRRPGEKGIPYGRLRNFLRLAGMVELNEHGLQRPVFTWLDHDNELGALVLTRAGTLSKRHVFNYFDQKSSIFDTPNLVVGGGGYTNDALEGVEKFWVAWGILHNALALAQENAPHGPAILSPHTDITRFRPWDQPDTLERLPREGEDVETMSDQFLLLLNTLVGTFRGKYDNQVQIYHPWSDGSVSADADLVEEMRPFAGMPGGNTSFSTDVLASSIPFITVGGRGEDIFHLWQLEGAHGPGSVFLTHTPVLHTRNVRAGRGDLMSEILNSYNGRIFREPPYLWAALARLAAGDPRPPSAEVEAETSERIDGLRAEAKASMAAVSGFAAAMEPYVDDTSEFWWLARAQSDPRCAEVLATLRSVVHEFKDVEKYHRLADEKLLRLEDVKELTEQFMAAYPHWETVVERLGGVRGKGEPGELAAFAAAPREGYGSPLRADAGVRTAATHTSPVEPPAPFEVVDVPAWQEVLTSSLLLFRRYERGLADQDASLEWDERVARLRDIYDHYAECVPDLPDFVWPTLFRDALLVPHSRPYQAVTELLDGDEPMDRVAEKYGVDADLLARAMGGVGATH